MIDRDRERELALRARAALDESIDVLDGDTVARLASARRRALGDRPPYADGLLGVERRRSRPALVAAGGLLAATLALAIGVSWWTRSSAELAAVESPEALEDLELLAANEELDLYENLEFYEWLEADGATG